MLTKKITQRIQRKWRHAKKAQILREVKKRVDWRAFEAIRSKYVDGAKKAYDSAGPYKYFEVDTYLPGNVERALKLGLHRGNPKRILDLGCGLGYFGLVCSSLGHQVLGLDFVEGNKKEVDCYAETHAIFGQNRQIHQIVKHEPLPSLEGPFDLVTAYQLCFALHNSPKIWGVSDWDYFLEDLKRFLSPNAKILLEFNQIKATKNYYSEELKEYFESLGGILNGRYLSIDHAHQPRKSQ